MVEKTMWCWWWGWNPEKLEYWLEEKERQGWNLAAVNWSSVGFRLRQGEPRQMSYCVDYQVNPTPEYYSILLDDGWELAWSGYGGWHLWRKPYEELESRPSLHTENQPIIIRTRWDLGLSAFFMLLFFGASGLAAFASKIFFAALFGVMSVIFGYFFVRFYQYFQRLRA